MNDDFIFIIIAVLIAAFIIVIVINGVISSLKKKIIAKDLEAAKYDGWLREKDLIHQSNIKDKDLQIEKMVANAKETANNLAIRQLEIWKENELEAHRKVIMEAATTRAQSMLAEWKITVEKQLRQDAVTRSMGVNFGKITEHLLPFSKHLIQFDPRDVRFIGTPVDLMIFDGVTQKKDIIDIYLVEIKTGTGQLSKKQKTIRSAIGDHRVHWLPIIVPEFKWDIPDDDQGV